MSAIVFFYYFLQVQSVQSQTSTPDWGKWGVIIAILSLLAVIILGVIQIRSTQKPKKEIKCFHLASTPLFTVDNRYKDDLSISYKGEKIDDATSVILRVDNSGQSAVKVDDFTRPITFQFAQDAKIINAVISDQKPSNINANISYEGNTNVIELTPLLMNSGDSIEISALISLFDKNIILIR